MDSRKKTNPLAIISLISGLLGFISLGLYWILYSMVTSSSEELVNRVLIPIMDGTVSVRNVCAPAAIITGVIALIEIKKKGGAEKGRSLAWVGIALGAGWIIFGLLVGVTFLLAETLH
jgi:hypothetical protein